LCVRKALTILLIMGLRTAGFGMPHFPPQPHPASVDEAWMYLDPQNNVQGATFGCDWTATPAPRRSCSMARHDGAGPFPLSTLRRWVDQQKMPPTVTVTCRLGSRLPAATHGREWTRAAGLEAPGRRAHHAAWRGPRTRWMGAFSTRSCACSTAPVTDVSSSTPATRSPAACHSPNAACGASSTATSISTVARRRPYRPAVRTSGSVAARVAGCGVPAARPAGGGILPAASVAGHCGVPAGAAAAGPPSAYCRSRRR
jgi:hypothetical protein